ncbi:MAG TPA: phosphoenolpyruvate-utilizing N-terminal domain-containing protein, partial [Polyangiaceae bacterium]
MEPPIPSTPPPSSSTLAFEMPRMLRGLAGSPGVAVGTALVVGDLHAIFARRHVHSAQFQTELARVKDAVTKAQEGLREVGARLAQEQTPILDAYVL